MQCCFINRFYITCRNILPVEKCRNRYLWTLILVSLRVGNWLFLLTFLITQNTIPDFDVSLRFLANEIFQVFFSFILTSCHFKITLIQIKKMRIIILWKLLKSKILVYTIFHYLELSIKFLSISSCKLWRVP